MNNVKIHNDLMIYEPYVLVTYTTKFGEVPLSTMNFLVNNYDKLKGVASSGNRLWGNNFAIAADLIAKQYNVKLLYKFELSGTELDLDRFIQEVNIIE
jgi:protein involved in ribonucleotide reduction